MTNLLGSNREAIEGFFEATRIYYRWPLLGCVDIPVWHVPPIALRPERHPAVPLDLVTFGTPIRYGWESDGYAAIVALRLPSPGTRNAGLSRVFPPISNACSGAEGDYVQQLGIAGTDIRPSRLASRGGWRRNVSDGCCSAIAPAQSLGSLQGGERSCPTKEPRCWSIMVRWPGEWPGAMPAMPCTRAPSGCSSMPKRSCGNVTARRA